MAKALIYGANGYTGELCTREMINQGINPVLAGRNESVRALAKRFECEARVFSLDTEPEKWLEGVSVVVNLAGPFARTQEPLIRACIAAGCHYLDIAGEVPEMQSAHVFDRQAYEAGVMLMPGAGFGVAPTDIAAKIAKDRLPEATRLAIMFATEGGVSRGTLSTLLKDIAQPGFERVNGQLKEAYPAQSRRTFHVAGKQFTGVYNPWRADLFTAGLSTNIANIETYSVFPGVVVQMMHGRLRWLRRLLLNRLLKHLPRGPSDRQLQKGCTYVKAVASSDTEERSVSLKGPEAYRFTAKCVTAIATRVLNGEVTPGFQTPSIYGKALLDDMAQIEWGT
jgi:short subunit dehydrogenase-like uncharacterized protein